MGGACSSDVRMIRLCLQAYVHRLPSCPIIPTLTYFAEFQLLHTPAAFQAERIAWRTVIYLNLVRSVRRCALYHHVVRPQTT